MIALSDTAISLGIKKAMVQGSCDRVPAGNDRIAAELVGAWQQGEALPGCDGNTRLLKLFSEVAARGAAAAEIRCFCGGSSGGICSLRKGKPKT